MSIEKELESVNLKEAEIEVHGDSPTWLKVIWADCPEKKLADYRGHALNYDGAESTSRIIRGIEGILGNVDKAVVELGVGILQKINELIGKAKK